MSADFAGDLQLAWSLCTTTLVMRPIGMHGNEVELEAVVGPLRVAVNVSYRVFEEALDEGPLEDWRGMDWVNLRLKVRLV